MKVRELLAKLHDLPVDALEKDIFIAYEDEELVDVLIEPITESCEDPTIVGYILCASESRQLELPFDKEPT